MDIEQQYRQMLKRRGWKPDADQLTTIALLSDFEKSLRSNFWTLWRKPRYRGMYIWGGTGRGKTMLMDLFAERHPRCQRTHFYRFMQGIHADLRTCSGHSDPLRLVAERIAAKSRLLCLDEFFVSDIGDAMILGRLLNYLFENNVSMLLTSNLEPGDLYQGGLHRERFLPSIDLIRRQLKVVSMAGETDYRYKALRKEGIYILDSDANKVERRLRTRFQSIAGLEEKAPHEGIVHLAGREVRAHAKGDGVIWFSFDELCAGNRAAADYLDLAREYHTLFLGPVPPLGDKDANATRRFVILIDMLYDHCTKLVIGAVAPVGELYGGSVWKFEFQRTRSRLIEMQSDNYLLRPRR